MPERNRWVALWSEVIDLYYQPGIRELIVWNPISLSEVLKNLSLSNVEIQGPEGARIDLTLASTGLQFSQAESADGQFLFIHVEAPRCSEFYLAMSKQKCDGAIMLAGSASNDESENWLRQIKVGEKDGTIDFVYGNKPGVAGGKDVRYICLKKKYESESGDI